MNLDGILGENLQELGFTLEEHEDILDLKCHGEQVAAFATWTATVKDIRDAAQAWLKEHETA